MRINRLLQRTKNSWFSRRKLIDLESELNKEDVTKFNKEIGVKEFAGIKEDLPSIQSGTDIVFKISFHT